MCGITGWVSFDRDLTAERTILDAMTRTMRCRGPDAVGVHLQPHIAFGHRRLAVIDVEGGIQPMTVEEDGRPLASLTYSGEVYNHRELRAELASRGHRFRTRSDTEVVLRSYLQWGEAFVERLNGMFAFAVWDARAEELLLVRDRMGVKPLYYHRTADGVIFGSEAKAVLAHPSVRPVVGLDGLRELLCYTKTPGHAIFQDLAEVVPGHIVRVRRTGLATRRYWGLEAREHTDDLGTTVATIRELLDDIVGRQLISDVPLCSLLSGGLDSSAITTLAARGLAASGRGPVRSFAVDFSGQTEHFQPDESHPTPDAPYARLLAEYVRADHSTITLHSSALMNRSNRTEVIRARDLPLGFADIDVSLLLLFRAVREHSTVALSGESADELFGGYRWFHHPKTVAAADFPWANTQAVLAGGDKALGPEHVLNGELLSKLDLEGYRLDRYHEALAEVPHVKQTNATEHRMREISYLYLTRFVRMLLDRKDRMSMATGLEVRVPFCDHRLTQYVFNTPWSMKTFDGREKSLLRAAVQDILPTEIAERVKVPYPNTQDPVYPRMLRAELAELAADRQAPVRPLLDTKAIDKALAPDVDPQLIRLGAELALDINTWLTERQVTLDVC